MTVLDTLSLLLVISVCIFKALFGEICVPVLHYWKQLEDYVPVRVFLL